MEICSFIIFTIPPLLKSRDINVSELIFNQTIDNIFEAKLKFESTYRKTFRIKFA